MIWFLSLQEDIGSETSLADPRQNATSTKNQNMSPERKLLADEVDLKCLLMCIGMLERVNGVSSLSLYSGSLIHSAVPRRSKKILPLRPFSKT